MLCVIFIRRKNKKDQNLPSSQVIKTQVKDPEEERKLGSEFDFNTKVGEIQKISVKQKYREDRVDNVRKEF